MRFDSHLLNMKIKITIEVIKELPEKLTQEEIQLYLKIFDEGIDKELYIHDPLYHYVASRQRYALLAGYKDWFMYGRIP